MERGDDHGHFGAGAPRPVLTDPRPATRGGQPPSGFHVVAGDRLRDLVEGDRWRAVRLSLIAVYVVAYAVWFGVNGLILDRISVLLALIVLLAVGHVGRPLDRWRRLGVDLGLFALMRFVYDETRGVADRLGMPLQVESVRDLDRVLFLGADPGVWLQRRFLSPDVVRWYDVVASVVYYSHFVVPVAVIAVLWITDRHEWVRFIRRFATVVGIACVGFILVPTAPPWMAAGGSRTYRLDALPPLTRSAGRGWRHLGLDWFAHAWETGRDWVNPVAAMPSLHAAFSLLVVVFFFPWISRRWVKAALLIFPLVMGVALVYLAEHYVVDVLAGWAVVAGSFLIWDHIERGRRRRRATASRHALDAASVSPSGLVS